MLEIPRQGDSVFEGGLLLRALKASISNSILCMRYEMVQTLVSFYHRRTPVTVTARCKSTRLLVIWDKNSQVPLEGLSCSERPMPRQLSTAKLKTLAGLVFVGARLHGIDPTRPRSDQIRSPKPRLPVSTPGGCSCFPDPFLCKTKPIPTTTFNMAQPAVDEYSTKDVDAPDGILTNRSVVWIAPKKVELQDRTIPEIGPKDVLVKVIVTGICGSDAHVWCSNPPKQPPVMGHESAGVIVRLGVEVSDRSINQRVAIEPSCPCLE